MYSQPIAYFITFTTRGSWLHGDERGSRSPEGKYIAPDPIQYKKDQARRGIDAFILSLQNRECVDTALRNFCARQKPQAWTIHALNVRSNHIHIAVTTKGIPIDSVVKMLKIAATKQLRESGQIPPKYKPWTENSSTRYVFTQDELREVIHYINHQDENH